ncbi:MAG TPA: fibronectin-binding domain-containing protein [Clostridiaceae bacterium]|nr:fibronectin-binding domain-containing protein [Clostridiaceae bacterium]
MDGITIAALSTELHHRLTDSLVDRVTMTDRHTLILHLYSQKEGRLVLTLGANPSRPVFGLTSSSPLPALTPPPSFTMFMRKHFRRARLKEVTSPLGERIINFLFDTVDDLGDERKLKLIFECMPRTANLIVVNEQNVILNALRHIDETVNRAREILPAHPYIAPPMQKRRSIRECLDMPYSELFAETNQKAPVSRVAYSTVVGFSPILGEEAAFRADLRSDHLFSALSESERLRLADALKSICHEIEANAFSPAIYTTQPEGTGANEQIVAHVISLTHLPYKIPFDRIADALTEHNAYVQEREALLRLQTSLSKRIGEHIKRTEKKRELHASDMAKGKTAELDKLKGELILAYIYSVPQGAQKVLLDNYYEPGTTILCELDPTRSPADNAARYFHRAKRNQRRLEAASKLLERDFEELAWLDSLAVAVRRAESYDDLLAIDHEYTVKTDRTTRRKRDTEQQLDDRSPGKPASKNRRCSKKYAESRHKSNRKKTKEAPPLPPRTFTSSDGFLIYVGRNNFQNESLLRKARKDDWWFHVKHVPGSHVIISTEGKDVPSTTLLEAAGIAVWYSGAGRFGGSAEVDYCRVRDVKKPSGALPGRVIYSQYKTIYTAPLDPTRLRRAVE